MREVLGIFSLSFLLCSGLSEKNSLSSLSFPPLLILTQNSVSGSTSKATRKKAPRGASQAPRYRRWCS